MVVKGPEGRESISADTVILAIGELPVNNLVRQLKNDNMEMIVIGDAKQTRKITDAIREGFEAALMV